MSIESNLEYIARKKLARIIRRWQAYNFRADKEIKQNLVMWEHRLMSKKNGSSFKEDIFWIEKWISFEPVDIQDELYSIFNQCLMIYNFSQEKIPNISFIIYVE